MATRTIAPAQPILFNERWTADQLITVSEIKRTYKLKDADIIGVQKVITKRKPFTVKYVKSEIMAIVECKAEEKRKEEQLNKEYPAFKDNKRKYEKMVKQMDKTKHIMSFMENLKERETRANGKFASFEDARSDQPFPPNVLLNIVRSIANTKDKNKNFVERMNTLRNLSETCKECHFAVFDCGIPLAEKTVYISKNALSDHEKRHEIFNRTMKDPLLLSMSDMIFMKVRSRVWVPMMVLYEFLVRFNITGPVRIPFKTWFYLQILKGRYVPNKVVNRLNLAT